MEYLTKTKQKQLARKVAAKAHRVKYPNNYQIGQARKKINEMVNNDPIKYVEFHGKYCIPHSDDIIIDDAVELLNSQQTLFDMEEVKYGK